MEAFRSKCKMHSNDLYQLLQYQYPPKFGLRKVNWERDKKKQKSKPNLLIFKDRLQILHRIISEYKWID